MIGKPCLSAWFFASAASASPMLILIFGVFGVHGNAIVTASYLVLSICGVACFGTIKDSHVGIADVPFLAFLVSIGISFAVNPMVASPKGIMQLMITFAAYPAARLLRADDIPLIRQACFWASAVIVVLGVVLTVPALVESAGEPARPLVFGFENAATAFSISLGLLVLTFVTSEPVLRSPKGLLTTVLISISSMTFAASMVRFTLLAILATLATCFILSVRERRLSLGLGLLIAASIVAGLLSRPITSAVYLRLALDGLMGLPSTELSTELTPSIDVPAALKRFEVPENNYCLFANRNNSLEIRKVMLHDAIYLAPRAGPVGFGLDSFGVLGCFKGLSPHNDVLQAIVEFGWFGGASFLSLITLPLILLFRPARADRDIRFVVLLCSFFIMLCMIYGRINGEIMLFMALGLAGSLVSARHTFEMGSGRKTVWLDH
jgi:hypothetical protein